MAQLHVEINGRKYPIICADGQEKRIQQLAKQIDTSIVKMVKEVGQLGEGQLLVMAALMLADENTELKAPTSKAKKAEASLADLVSDLVPAKAPLSEFDDTEDQIVGYLEHLTKRVEALAERVEKY